MIVPVVGIEQAGDAARGFAGGDAEAHVVTGAEGGDGFGGTGKERIFGCVFDALGLCAFAIEGC